MGNKLDVLDKIKLGQIETKLIKFRITVITDYISRMDKKMFSTRKEYHTKADKDINNCARDIMEVVNK